MTIMQVALSPFGHSDRDFAFFDPLSTNRRLPGHADLPVLATVVFAGPTLVPDCLFPPVGSEVQIDLRHFLMLKPATDINEDNPQPGLAGELCTNPVTPTLLLKQKDYWEEVTPLLARWRNVNDGRSVSTWLTISGYVIRMFLEVSGQHIPYMVLLRAEWKGPHQTYSSLP